MTNNFEKRQSMSKKKKSEKKSKPTHDPDEIAAMQDAWLERARNE